MQQLRDQLKIGLTYILVFVLAALCSLNQKSVPEKIASEYIEEELDKSTRVIKKVDKKLSKQKADLKQLKKERRLIYERDRCLRRLAGSDSPVNEIDSELQKLDNELYSEIIDKYFDKRSKKKIKSEDSEKNFNTNPLKNEDSLKKPKTRRKSKKDLEKGSKE